MLNLLLVDDQEFICDLVKDIITFTIPDKYNVVCAHNAVTALELLKEQPFDIVLTDIEMPVMNGLELYKQLLDLKFPGKVITMSAEKEYNPQLLKGLDFVKNLQYILGGYNGK